MSVAHHRVVTVIFLFPDYSGSTQTVHRHHCQYSSLEILLSTEEEAKEKVEENFENCLQCVQWVTETPFLEKDFAVEIFLNQILKFCEHRN